MAGVAVPVAPVVGPCRDPPALEVRRTVELPVAERSLGDIGSGRLQCLADLVRGEGVEGTLDAPPVGVERVGILGGGDAATREAEVSVDVLDDLGGHLAIAGVTGDLVGMDVELQEPGLVVEHLLEVGDDPVLVHRVPGEPAAEVVVDAAGCHRVERGLDHRQGVRRSVPGERAHDEVEVLGRGELRRRAEAAPLVVMHAAQVPVGTVECLARRRCRRRRRARPSGPAPR